MALLAQSTTTSTAEVVDDALIPNLSIDIPGVTFSPVLDEGGVLQIDFLGEYVSGVYIYLLGIGTTIAIVFIMVAGLRYALSAGGGNVEGAKTMIRNSITGLILLLCTYALLFIVNPNLTLLSGIEIENINLVTLSTENTAADVSGKSLPGCPTTGTNSVPYFCQRNYSNVYGSTCEGSPTISSSGCGPTSMAMVLSYYKKSTDPVQVAASFEKGHRVCGVGTAYSAFTSSSVVKDNGMEGDVVWAKTRPDLVISTTKQTEITNYLTNNKPILISVGKSRFTGSGHFMVLTGVNADGSFSLNDPNSGYTSVTKEELWPILKYAVYIHPKN